MKAKDTGRKEGEREKKEGRKITKKEGGWKAGEKEGMERWSFMFMGYKGGREEQKEGGMSGGRIE